MIRAPTIGLSGGSHASMPRILLPNVTAEPSHKSTQRAGQPACIPLQAINQHQQKSSHDTFLH